MIINFIYIASFHRKTYSRRFTLYIQIHVVLRPDLNDTIHSAHLKDVGRELHSCGQNTLNVRLYNQLINWFSVQLILQILDHD